MTAGTSPAWRSFRALPLPSVWRALALSETVAIRTNPYEHVHSIAAKPACVGAYSQVAASTLPSVAGVNQRAAGYFNKSIEQRRDRLLRVSVSDRFRDQLAHRKDRQLRRTAGFRHQDGVGHRHFLYRRVG